MLIFIGIIFGLLFSIGCGVGYLFYRNNTAWEIIYLDGQKIYSGRSRNIVWGQLGEVGNKYSVKEYKIGFWNIIFGRIINYWVGSDLIVKNK